MPSASGVYSLPPGYLAATGTTIQTSQHNPIFEDVAAALTARLSRDGTAPMTGPLLHAAGTVTAPGSVFAADPSSGFYKTTAGIGVAISGTKVAEFVAGGVIGARVIGELVPYSGSISAPPLFVFPFGQTLSRTTFATLWAFVQVEIAAGNQFYNNGDGSTTFGIGDLRGRVWGAVDNMGGTTANRLVNGSMAGVRHTVGGAGGADTNLLTVATLPVGITSAALNSISVILSGASAGSGVPITGSPGNISFSSANSAGGPAAPNSTAGSWAGASATSSGNNNIQVTSTNTGGQAHDNLQPMILGNYILFAGA